MFKLFGHYKRRAQKLQAALTWYADESNHKRAGTNAPGEKRTWSTSPMANDRGRRARRVLDELGVMQPPSPFTITTPEPRRKHR